MMNAPRVCFFGHHKAASTWVMRVVDDVCKYTGLKHGHFHGPCQFGYDLERAVKAKGLDVLSYTNADKRYVEQLGSITGFHIIRDPRDVCVSSYFSHLKTHATDLWPELSAYRDKLSHMSFQDGMIDNMHFTARLPADGDDLRYFDCLLEWNYEDDAILELRYEDMILNPYEMFSNIFAHLGLLDERFIGIKQGTRIVFEVLAARIGVPSSWRQLLTERKLPFALLDNSLRKMSFQRLTEGRLRGKEDQNSHMRKGVAGDWRNHFDAEIKAAFKESYGNLLIHLGYETSYDW